MSQWEQRCETGAALLGRHCVMQTLMSALRELPRRKEQTEAATASSTLEESKRGPDTYR